MGCSSGGSVTLDDELEFVRNYLAIESARFGDRVRFHIEPANGAGSVRLPGLTLQPIVENGIKYGLAERVSGGELNIQIQHDRTRCIVTVRNQFDSTYGVPDLSPAAVFRSGHALANIRDRLRLAFGNRASIQIQREGDWIASIVVVPMGERL
jgi:LytS/YehU family sensor histidine kinase